MHVALQGGFMKTILRYCVLVALPLAGCAGTGQLSRSPTLAHVPYVTLDNGDLALVVRDYVDELKIEGHDVLRRYKYFWNYTRGVAQEQVLDQQGVQISFSDAPALTLSATSEEQEFAFQLVRADPAQADKLKPESQLYGGFIFREPHHRYCDLGSRCIHVFASDDHGNNTTLHVIVDLMKGIVIEPAPNALPGIAANKR
jgi:hypothetical protein